MTLEVREKRLDLPVIAQATGTVVIKRQGIEIAEIDPGLVAGRTGSRDGGICRGRVFAGSGVLPRHTPPTPRPAPGRRTHRETARSRRGRSCLPLVRQAGCAPRGLWRPGSVRAEDETRLRNSRAAWNTCPSVRVMANSSSSARRAAARCASSRKRPVSCMRSLLLPSFRLGARPSWPPVSSFADWKPALLLIHHVQRCGKRHTPSFRLSPSRLFRTYWQRPASYWRSLCHTSRGASGVPSFLYRATCFVHNCA